MTRTATVPRRGAATPPATRPWRCPLRIPARCLRQPCTSLTPAASPPPAAMPATTGISTRSTTPTTSGGPVLFRWAMDCTFPSPPAHPDRWRSSARPMPPARFPFRSMSRMAPALSSDRSPTPSTSPKRRSRCLHRARSPHWSAIPTRIRSTPRAAAGRDMPSQWASTAARPLPSPPARRPSRWLTA